jgi:hypothetical protein
MEREIKNNSAKKKSRNQAIYFLALIIVGAIVVFILWKRGFIGGKPSVQSPQQIIYSIFERPRDSNSSGITQATVSGDIVVIKYNFYPVGISSFQNELGIDLSDKIQIFFKNTSTYKEITILVNGPLEDKLGNMSWKPILSFKFTESLYYMTNWQNFKKQNLLDVAEDVTWFRKLN